MVKISIPKIFSSISQNGDDVGCVMTSVTIPGEVGKQITIDELTLNQFTMSSKATGTSWVTADVDGVITELARWTEAKTDATPKGATTSLTAGIGKSVKLTWRLITSSSAIRVKIKDVTYSYTVKSEENKVAQWLVVVECSSQEEASAKAAELAGKGVTVYTRTTV